MVTLKAATDYHILTGDIKVVRINPLLPSGDGKVPLGDSNPDAEVTACFRSLKEAVQITTPVTAVYDATEKKWIATFTREMTLQFLKVPTDPTSDLKYKTVDIEVQVGPQGSIQSFIYRNVKVEKGTID